MTYQQTFKLWLLTTLSEEERQYAGNKGYKDNWQSLYSYDSNVANCKRLNVGDLVFIRDRFRVIGAAKVENINKAAGLKSLMRCPTCGTTGLRRRKRGRALYRCGKGHEFNAPRIEKRPVVIYTAYYGKTFVPISNGAVAKAIKRGAFRPNDQLAIEELNPLYIERNFSRENLALITVVNDSVLSQGIDADAAEEEVVAKSGNNVLPFIPSLIDRRKAVLRSIKERRGQKAFRDNLKREYGPVCMISECCLWAAIEAAHIGSYRGIDDNHIQNGLLLRADLHTLFDLNLMAIHPEALIVHFQSAALENGYKEFEGKKLRITQRCRPSFEALRNRWAIFSKSKSVY